MSVEATQGDEGETSENELSSLDANNFIRGQAGACLIIEETIQGETIETVFFTVDRQYFRLKEVGKPAKVERFTMSQALEDAQKHSQKSARLGAYQQSSLDIEDAIEFIDDTFTLDAEEAKGGYGMTRDQLDEVGDDHLEVASAPAGTSDEHGGGW